jgi:hypothetical protein
VLDGLTAVSTVEAGHPAGGVLIGAFLGERDERPEVPLVERFRALFRH